MGLPAGRRAGGPALGHLRAVRRPRRFPAAPAADHPAVPRRRVGPHVDPYTAHPLPDVPGRPSWSDHLVAAQRHLLSVNHAEGQTYLGVTFARRSLGTRSPSGCCACSAGASPRANAAGSAAPSSNSTRCSARSACAAAGSRPGAGVAALPLGGALHGAAGRCPRYQRAVGPGRPAGADRTGRALPHAVRLDGQAGEPDDRRGTARRRALHRPDGASGDPRKARAVDALPRAAALADGALLRVDILGSGDSFRTSSTGSG